MRKNLFLMCTALACAVLVSCSQEEPGASESMQKAKPAGATTTAQSIMVDIDGPSNFTISGSEVWKFDADEAIEWAVDNYTFSALSSGLTLEAAKNDFFSSNRFNPDKCAFWTGNIGALPSSGVYTFKYKGVNYSYTVTAPIELPVKTAWTLHSNTASDLVQILVNINIAGQSVVNKGGQKKYSFALGGVGEEPSRIQNLVIELVDESGVASHINVGYETLYDNGENGIGNLVYAANAGEYGVAIPSLLNNLTIKEIIAKNAWGSTTAIGNAAVAKVDPFYLNLAAGSYKLTVSATVKGNEGAADVQFSGSSSFTIDAQGCEK